MRKVHMHELTKSFLVLVLTGLACNQATLAQSLSGSRESIDRQYQAAVSYGYSFMDTPQAVNRFVDSGHLVRVQQSGSLSLHNVSHPYARPQVRLFLERLSQQYIAACGEKLTVTSLTRPLNRQPANASQNSVHPTGMAVDLRIPNNGRCRSWLESTLLSLEKADVLDVTRERNPPHYHIAVFTQPYEAYVAGLQQESREYTVRKGDTLSTIATRNGSSVQQLRSANGLRGDLIRVGQVLQVPGKAAPAAAPTQVATASVEQAPPVLEDALDIASLDELTHQVRRGETLWRIARRYGTSVSNLREENGLADDFLQIGQVLKVNLLGGNP
jgi:LysM repeat protein